MQWDAEKLRQSAASDPEAAWMGTVKLVPDSAQALPKRRGAAHPVAQLAERSRLFLLAKGFNELILPPLVDEKDAFMQAGSEAPLLIDRSHYLAAVPRPPAADGVDITALRAIAPSFDDAKAKALLKLAQSFASGELSSREVLDRMVARLGVRMEQATQLLALAVPGIQQPKPALSSRLLRDSLTTAWFESLSAVVRREPLPALLFAVGLDESRDGPSLSVSFVVMGEDASLDAGEQVLSALMSELGVPFSAKKRKATSHQFVPGTESSLVSGDGELAVGSFGMLSPVALSNYDISVPAFCATVSLSASSASLSGSSSERAALFPQFYGNWLLPDSTIAALVKVGEAPATDWGQELARKLVKTAELYGSQRAPCEFKVFEREFGDSRVEVWLVAQSGTLCSESALDEVVVSDGSILALPAMARGGAAQRTGVRLIDSFASMVASRVERDPLKPQRFAVESAESLSEANVSVPRVVLDYVQSKGKAPILGARMGLCAESRVKRLWVHEQPR